MTWETCNVEDQRLKFCQMVMRNDFSFAQVCSSFGISRPTGYKWYRRYLEQGAYGLSDYSRAPKRSPNRVSDAFVDDVLSVKAEYPNWGARKIRHFMIAENPGVSFPSESTFFRTLERHGLVKKRRKHRAFSGGGNVLVDPTHCNDIWTADFKGEFRTRDGIWCYPLTIQDAYSRYLIGCDGKKGPRNEDVILSFSRAFETYGIPAWIVTDNGVPFRGMRGFAGLTRLSAFWLSLGILVGRTRKGHPEDNGRHERMHRTLKQETACPPAWDLGAQQDLFSDFLQNYNFKRPHEALSGRRPGEVYHKSSVSLVDACHFSGAQQIRRVNGKGYFKWRQRQYFLSETLAHHELGFGQLSDNEWSISLGRMQIGTLTEQDEIYIHGFEHPVPDPWQGLGPAVENHECKGCLARFKEVENV